MKYLANILSTRHLLIIDALRYSLELEKKSFSSLKRAMDNIERSDSHNKKLSQTIVLSALSNAWNLVDITYRIRGLITQVPDLSQNLVEIKLFLRNTKSVEDFRHLYQHLNSAIPKISGSTNQIMGVLSWETSKPFDSITIFLGTGSPEISAHSVALDTHKMIFAQKLLFSAGNKDIELDKIHQKCRAISKFINKWLKSKNYLSDKVADVSVMRFKIRFLSNNKLQPTTESGG